VDFVIGEDPDTQRDPDVPADEIPDTES